MAKKNLVLGSPTTESDRYLSIFLYDRSEHNFTVVIQEGPKAEVFKVSADLMLNRKIFDIEKLNELYETRVIKPEELE